MAIITTSGIEKGEEKDKDGEEERERDGEGEEEVEAAPSLYQVSDHLLQELAALLHLVLGTPELHDVALLGRVGEIDDDLREGRKGGKHSKMFILCIFVFLL